VRGNAEANLALQGWVKQQTSVLNAAAAAGTTYQAQREWFEKQPGVRDEYRNVTVTTKEGKPVTVFIRGKLRGSASEEHYSEMLNKAIDLAKTGKYEAIYFQHAWKTVAGGAVEGMEATAGELPDILAVRRGSQRIDAWEVFSEANGSPLALRQKLRTGMKSIPANRRGKVGGDDEDGVIVPPSLKVKGF
jgi:hypothetical protein